MFFPIPTHRRPRAGGFTLIELLVVVVILATVAILVIPSVRTLNEDRKVRDTARIVGAVFAAARERAAVDGQAGVEIISIANAGGVYNVPNMGLALFELRSIPPYVGDTVGATATLTDPTTLSSGDPMTVTVTGSSLAAANVQPNDYIELNQSGVRFRILAVAGTVMEVEMDWENIRYADGMPLPPFATALPFRIYRQPVRIQSSAVRLPNNLFLNLALSGYGFAPTTVGVEENEYQGRQFRDFTPQPPAGHPDAMNYPDPEGSTLIWFARDGSVDRVTTREYVPGTLAMPPDYDRSYMNRPNAPLYFLLCSGDGDNVDLTNLDGSGFLQNGNNVWISVDHRNGSVSINRVAQVNQTLGPANTIRTQVEDARLLVQRRRGDSP